MTIPLQFFSPPTFTYEALRSHFWAGKILLQATITAFHDDMMAFTTFAVGAGRRCVAVANGICLSARNIYTIYRELYGGRILRRTGVPYERSKRGEETRMKRRCATDILMYRITIYAVCTLPVSTERVVSREGPGYSQRLQALRYTGS